MKKYGARELNLAEGDKGQLCFFRQGGSETIRQSEKNMVFGARPGFG